MEFKTRVEANGAMIYSNEPDENGQMWMVAMCKTPDDIPGPLMAMNRAKANTTWEEILSSADTDEVMSSPVTMNPASTLIWTPQGAIEVDRDGNLDCDEGALESGGTVNLHHRGFRALTRRREKGSRIVGVCAGLHLMSMRENGAVTVESLNGVVTKIGADGSVTVSKDGVVLTQVGPQGERRGGGGRRKR